MLSTEEFRKWGASAILFLHVTSRTEDEPHPRLLEEKGGQGFPYVVALDSGGEVLGQLGDRSVEGFAALVKTAGEYVELRDSKARTPDQEVHLLALEVGMGKVEAAAARTRLDAIAGAGEAGKKEKEALLVTLDIEGALGSVRAARGSAESKIAAGKEFARMWAEGREPGPDAPTVQPFFILMLDYAESKPDAALFESALGRLRAKFGDLPQAKPFFENQGKRLEKLREAAEPAAGEPKPEEPKPEEPKKE